MHVSDYFEAVETVVELVAGATAVVGDELDVVVVGALVVPK